MLMPTAQTAIPPALTCFANLAEGLAAYDVKAVPKVNAEPLTAALNFSFEHDMGRCTVVAGIRAQIDH
jgi:hypothetical protein